MAFFKFRLPGQTAGEPQGNHSATPAESVEAMRRRARHRLIGASVLVLIGVVGFPLLFDTQPRPVSVDIAVTIPDRADSKPLVDTSKSKAKPLAASAGLDPKEEVVADAKPKAEPPPAQPEPKPEAAVAPVLPKPDSKPESKPDVKTEAKADAVKAEQRFVVQVGAFTDESKAREVRTKLDKAGFKTYTHVAETKEGPRTRVRVGPFTSRDEADKAARKIKQLQMQPQVLTL
jgi:DedD protein